jgi:hypothetical protein
MVKRFTTLAVSAILQANISTKIPGTSKKDRMHKFGIFVLINPIFYNDFAFGQSSKQFESLPY